MAKHGGDTIDSGWSTDFLPENAEDGFDATALEQAIREARMDTHLEIKWGLRLAD